MRLAIVAVLAVGAVIVGSALTISATETRWNTWQEAVNELDDITSQNIYNDGSIIYRIQDIEQNQNSTYQSLTSKDAMLDSRISNLSIQVSELTQKIEALENFTDIPKVPRGAGPGVYGMVYQDTNENGQISIGEGVAGVEVIAVKVSDHTDVTRTTTDTNGNYYLELERHESYLIQVISGGSDAFRYVAISQEAPGIINILYN